jgi:hypothetical protein
LDPKTAQYKAYEVDMAFLTVIGAGLERGGDILSAPIYGI